MGNGSRILLAAALALSTSAVAAGTDAAPPADTALEAEGVIFERQQIMSRLEKDAATLGRIVAGAEPASKLKDTTRALADGARDSLAAYRANPLPGGRTRPEAWANNADFMQRMEAFARNAEAMAVAGDKGDVMAVTGLMIDALPCKQCHDLYRERKPG